MKKNRKLINFRCVIVLVILICCETLYSQIRIESVVKNEEGQPIENVHVLILNIADSSLHKGAIGNMEGKIVIMIQSPEDKILQIRALGYKSYFSALEDVPEEIVMESDATMLKEFNVTEKRELVKIVDGKFLYNVQAIQEKKVVTTAFDVVKELPSVVSKNEESLEILGARQTSLLIDGKVSTMSYSEIINYLKALPADKVESVEISYNAPAEWYVKGSAINVVLKKTKDKVYSGQLGAIYGYNGAHRGMLRAANFFSSAKWDIYASYIGGYTDNKFRTKEYILHKVKDKYYEINNDDKTNLSGQQNRIYTSISYNITENNTINVSYIGDITPYTREEEDIQKSYIGNSRQKSEHEVYIQQVSMYYKYKKLLQTGVEYTNYQMNRQQFSQYDINEIWQDAFLYKASQEINKLMGYANINNSLPKGWSLSYGGKYIYTQNSNKQDNEGLLQGVANITSRNLIWEHDASVFTSVRKSFLKDKINVDATLTYEYNNMSGYETSNLLPRVTISYMLSKKHLFQLSNYSDRTHPSYWQKRDYVMINDKYSIAIGNSKLKPSFENITTLNYILMQSMSFGLVYAYSKNNFISQSYQLPDTLLMIDQIENIKKTQIVGANIAFPVQIGKRFSLQFQGHVRYQQYATDNWHGMSYDNRFWQFIFNNSNDITLSFKPLIIFNASVQYISPGMAGIYKYYDTWNLSTAIKGLFFDKRLTVGISLSDILEKANPTMYVRQGNQYYNRNSNFYNRFLQVAITYQFRGYKQREEKDINTSRFGMDLKETNGINKK